MNHLSVIVDDIEEEYELACELDSKLVKKGILSYWELGPVCSRNHAHNLENLRLAVKHLLMAKPDSPDYRRSLQEVHSCLNHKP